MRGVALRASISERTIYRYFPNLETLQTAIILHLRQRVGHPLCESAAELGGYVVDLYRSFETNQQLTRVLAGSLWAAPILKRTRRENRDALRRLLSAEFPRVDKATLESAAAGLRVPLSAAGWIYLVDCGYSNLEAIRHVQWLVESTLETLRRQQRSQRER